MEILHLFRRAFQLQSTDPSDKGFAIVGLCKEMANAVTMSELVVPEYAKTAEQVLKIFTRYCIIQSKTLEVLSLTSMTANKSLIGPLDPVVP